MKKIHKIEPTVIERPTRKKVAAYARVSAETDRTMHSLSAQISYYSDLIQKRPEWEYAGVFVDEAISGTSENRRTSFLEMIAAAESGNIDIILTKSISRFARNTVDLLETVRHLKEIGVEVRFEKEGINSLSEDGELMLTLLASFAQEESRSISENIRWSIQKRFEQGIPNGKFRILGYEWEDDHLVIVPDEAAVVKRIFQNFLDGKSRLETERELNGEGITTKGGYKWCDSNIKVILTNITYTGNLLLNKEYLEDHISKKRRKNRGEKPRYFVENTHEAIIDMETFQFVQDEMARRKELGALANKSLNITCFTGKLKCPHCGVSLMHNSRKREKGTEDYWKCGTTKQKGGRCPVKGGIRDDKLRLACARALGMDEFDEDIFLDQVDHIDVPERYTIEIHMKDGRIIPEDCTPTGHQDCWTQEYRNRVSVQRRKNGTNPKGGSCFTSKIKCAECGNNYRRQTRRKSTGDKYYLFGCATTNTCSNNCIHEDTLMELSAKALGTDSFDEAVFREQIDHIDIAPGGGITFFFLDGHEVQMTYSTKRRMPGWTPERRERQVAAIRASFTEERRQKMSEKMKKIRSERYWNSTGKSRQSQQP